MTRERPISESFQQEQSAMPDLIDDLESRYGSGPFIAQIRQAVNHPGAYDVADALVVAIGEDRALAARADISNEAQVAAYVASNAGLATLTRIPAQEASPFGVRVRSLAPDVFRTPIDAEVWQSEAGFADLLDKIPLGCIGEPDEIAAMAVVLAPDAANYLTGTTVFVDGGMTDYPSFRHGG